MNPQTAAPRFESRCHKATLADAPSDPLELPIPATVRAVERFRIRLR